MSTRRPPQPSMPDLSHLTEEERKIIEDVLRRQQEEDGKEEQILRTLQNEVETITKKVAQQKAEDPLNTGLVCQICNKTKFADGIGHTCNYCQLRVCARCGGKLNLKNKSGKPLTSKTVWSCNLCRKKQEIMAKTGGWYHGPGGKPVSLDLDSGSETASQASRPDASPPEKKQTRQQNSQADSGIGSERESTGRPSISRTASQKGRELKRQYSSERAELDHELRRGAPPPDPRDPRDLRRTPSEARRRSESADPELRYRHERERALYADEQRRHHSDSASSHTGERSRRGSAAGERALHRDSPDRHHAYAAVEHRAEQRERRASTGGEVRTSDVLERRSSTRGDKDAERERHRGNREPEYHERQRNHRKDAVAAASSGGVAGMLRDPEKPGGCETPTRHPARDMRPRNGEHKDAGRRGDDVGEGRSSATLERMKHEAERGGGGGGSGGDIYRDERGSSKREDRGQRRDPDRDPRPEKSRSHDVAERKPSREYDSRRGSARDDVAGGEHGGAGAPSRQSLSRQNSRDYDVYGVDKSPPLLPRHHLREDDLAATMRDLEPAPPKTHLDPSSASAKSYKGGNSTSRRKVETMLRNDSLSSDQSECVRPPPPKPHKHRSKNKQRRQHSLSSSDDEIRSTPECTSCDDGEIESESVSEKGDPELWDEPWKRDEILAAKIKKFLAHPVTWQPNANGTKLIGHMILKKTVKDGQGRDSSAILGLKVVGGKMTESGRLGAFITKVKKGSIADTVGHLKPGDEVIEWNGRSLKDATFEEVYDIIFESKHEPQVELVVQRNLDIGPIGSELSERHRTSQKTKEHVSLDRRPSVTVTSPGARETTMLQSQPPEVVGRIELKLYHNSQQAQLLVMVMCATELPLKAATHQPRNPYVKMVLLPDRNDKRRTKTVAMTCEPRWDQTFVFQPVREQDLLRRSLVLTVWDYDRHAMNDFLGEVVLDLGVHPLDNTPQWFHLRPHTDHISLPLAHQQHGRRHSDTRHQVAPAEYLMPPHGRISGFSDSDLSEFDYEDSLAGGVQMVERDERERIAAEKREAELRARLEVPEPGAYPRHQRSPMPSERDSKQQQQQQQQHAAPRAKSPRRDRLKESAQRSMSPLEMRGRGLHSEGEGTPDDSMSPKKRQLPQIPLDMQGQRDKIAQDLEQRALKMKMKMKMNAYKTAAAESGMGSDSGSTSYSRDRRLRKEMSPDNESLQSADSDGSETSKVSITSALSTQSERPRGNRKLSEFTSKMQQGVPTTTRVPPPTRAPKPPMNRSFSNSDVGYEKTDGSLSDSAAGMTTEGKQRRPSIGVKVASFVGLNRKSSSTSQLSATDTGTLPGGRKRSSVQRSEEVGMPDNLRSKDTLMTKQHSRESNESVSSDSSSQIAPWNVPRVGGPDGQFGDFIDGLGPGQLVGRQVLGMPIMGDFLLELSEHEGRLHVQVHRAKGLQQRAGTKMLPAPYVKVYMMDGKHCVAKAKTTISRRTLDPLYQQVLVFAEPYQGKLLQITVWGDYGRLEKKVFMGVAQVVLEELDLSTAVKGWYKLFHSSSLVGAPSTTGSASRKGSLTSLDSVGTMGPR